MIDESWQQVYGARIDDLHLPEGQAGRRELMARYGKDGYYLLERVLAAIQGGRHRAGCVFAGERGFRGGSGCGGVACDGTVSVSVTGRPSPLPFCRSPRGGP